MNDDLEIDGNIWLVGAQYCHYCDLTGDFDADADDPYKADVRIYLGPTCNIECNGGGEARCKMNDNEDELDCTLDVGPCTNIEEIFEKKGD